MRLVMYSGKAIIDSIGVEPDKLSVPGYLGSCIRKLKEKNILLLEGTDNEPEFFVQRLREIALQPASDSVQPTLF